MKSNKILKRHSIRTDFVLLLHLSILGLFFAIWLLFSLLMTVSGEDIFYSFGEFLYACLIILIVAAFISVISVALSNVLKQDWWIAVPGLLLLLGTPLIGLMITWIGKQIARWFYLATTSDLQRTKLILDMTVKPRKGIIYPEPVQPDKENGQDVSITPEEIEKKSKKQTAELREKKEKQLVIQAKPALPRFFGLWQCVLAALFGGAFAGGMLLAFNYKHLQERRNYIIGIIISLLGQFALLMLMSSFSYVEAAMPVLISIVSGISIGVYFWYKELQHEDIKHAIELKKAEKRSWWVVIGFVVLSWLIIVVFYPLVEEIIWSLNMPFIY